jgi:hypothetical protein
LVLWCRFCSEAPWPAFLTSPASHLLPRPIGGSPARARTAAPIGGSWEVVLLCKVGRARIGSARALTSFHRSHPDRPTPSCWHIVEVLFRLHFTPLGKEARLVAWSAYLSLLGVRWIGIKSAMLFTKFTGNILRSTCRGVRAGSVDNTQKRGSSYLSRRTTQIDLGGSRPKARRISKASAAASRHNKQAART